jgi:hypothetical protein
LALVVLFLSFHSDLPIWLVSSRIVESERCIHLHFDRFLLRFATAFPKPNELNKTHKHTSIRLLHARFCEKKFMFHKTSHVRMSMPDQNRACIKVKTCMWFQTKMFKIVWRKIEWVVFLVFVFLSLNTSLQIIAAGQMNNLEIV